MKTKEPYLDIRDDTLTIRAFDHDKNYENRDQYRGLAKLSHVSSDFCHIHSMCGDKVGKKALYKGFGELKALGYKYIIADRDGKLRVIDIKNKRTFDLKKLIESHG